MKKHITIIALLAAGTAFANASTTVVFDFGRSDSQTEGAINIYPSVGTNGKYGALEHSGSLVGMSGSYSFEQEASGGNFSNAVTLLPGEESGWKNPLSSLPEGWENTFADGLTSQLVPNSDYANEFLLSFTGLESGYYNLSVLGGYFGSDNLTPNVQLTLGGEGVDCSLTTWLAKSINDGATGNGAGVNTFTQNVSNGSSNEGYVFDVNEIFVGESGELTIAIIGSLGGESYRTPLNGLKLTLIPEPSAFGLLAGLGALALVGTRRRRK